MLVVFDLDDTLYLERDFALSGFAAAGAWFNSVTGISEMEPVCISLFEAGERRHVFDRALSVLGIEPEVQMVRDLVSVYREHRPRIELAPDAARYLGSPHSGKPFALITDGHLATQRAKIDALGLRGRIGHIICTDALGPGRGKPHPHAFELVEARAQGDAGTLLYVADNPAKDFVTPRARGWLTVRIAREGRLHDGKAPDAAHEAHLTITSLDELDRAVSRSTGRDVSGFPPRNGARSMGWRAI